VKFLKWDKTTRFKFKGLDDSFRDIQDNRHFKFKQQWTSVLWSMVVWVRLVYPDAGQWAEYLLTTKEKVDWSEIRDKLEVAEVEVQTERDRLEAVVKKTISAKTKRGRGMFVQHVKSDLTEPHVLEGMRGLLCEL
jgi:hypothetical protein